MLSRNAQGLYWMGRYLERAQHGCHLLAEQFIIIEDRPVEQIDQSWRRLYMAVGRTPLGGHLDPLPDDEDFMLADAYTLADDLTFEPTNPGAIRNCVAGARESARQVRNVIPTRCGPPSISPTSICAMSRWRASGTLGRAPSTTAPRARSAPSRVSPRARFTVTTAGTSSSSGASSNGCSVWPR